MSVPLNAVLKYSKVAEGHIFKARELVLEIDGLRHNEFLDHNTRVACLTRALEKLNTEIEQVADRFTAHKLGAYLWLYTPGPLRGEELEDLYRLYYLLEIVKHLFNEGVIDELLINANVNSHVKEYLHEAGIKFKCDFKACFASGFISAMQGFKTVYSAAKFNLKCLLSKPNGYFKGVLIDSSPNFRTNRYDNIHKVAELYKNVRYFASQQTFVSGIDQAETVVFRKEINLLIILHAFFKAIRIGIFIKRNRTKIPSGLFHYHNTFFNLLLYHDLTIAELCFEKYLAKCDITKVILVSTLTIPAHRLLISAARRKGAVVINVASRTYGPYESSDILLNCDVNGCSNTNLPDWFILKDRYSAEKTFSGYPRMSNRVLIGGRYLFKTGRPENANSSLPTALLILFNHKRDISYRLLRAIEQSGLPSQVTTVIYRCHHIFVFADEVIRSAFPNNNIINITGKDYSLLDNYRIVTITGPTTAAMEVIQLGSVVVWAPWVWDESIIIDDVMRNVGVLTQNLSELTKTAQTLLSDTDIFEKQYLKDMRYCENFFNTKTTISEQLEKIETMSY